MAAKKKDLGELLIKEKLISLQQLEQAKLHQAKSGGRLSMSLVQQGILSEEDLTQFIGRQYNVATVDLRTFEIDRNALKTVSRQFCEKNVIIPVQKAGRNLVVAFADPTNIYAVDDLSLLTKCRIEIVVASESAIRSAIDRYYEQNEALTRFTSEMTEGEEAFIELSAEAEFLDKKLDNSAGPIIKFVNTLLAEAIRMRASDIHIEPYERRLRIRFRVDGGLIEKSQPPPGAGPAICSRIKMLSKMDIAERRMPQDGRLKVRLKNSKEIDFRVSSVPTLYGEKIVMRILDKGNLQMNLEKLGFEKEDLKKLEEAIHQPQGMVLITGPTGSGKTTTIYSALAELNTADRNILSVEDPIEYNVDGINQVQVNTEIGFDFPLALRAFLRQDPEIIMVGEIRDLETASIAYKAASTGHMVVSTLHTNDTASTVTRLVDMGVPTYIVAEATTLVVSQRLMKTICMKCIDDHQVDKKNLLEIGVVESELHLYSQLKRGRGCSRCNGTGLWGREAVFEVMEITAKVKEAIFSGKTPIEVKRYAMQYNKMRSLRQNALLKLSRGVTTVEQVISSTLGDPIG